MDCDNVITKSAQHSHARMIAIIDLSLDFFNNNIYIYIVKIWKDDGKILVTN